MDLTFGTALSQSGRLLQLTTPLGEHQLQALRVHGVERIGRVPRYTLDVVVQDTEYDPEKLIGQPVSLAILCDDGSPAQRHGLVESVRYLGNDGGLHDWQLVFAPWFSLLEYRLDCRIWQDKNLPAILEAVFSLYEQAKGNYRLDLRREYAPLSYVTQFNESDANFVQRWCEQEGIFWYVEHTADKHCIVFTDTVDTLPALAPQSIRFHTQNATEKQDGITQWSSGSQLLSGKLHWRSVDYLAHGQPRETVMPALQAASAPQALERYEYQGQYGWQKQDRGEWLSRVQIEQRESQARRIQGQSGVRQMEAGRWFELTQHPLYERKAAEERQFLLIEVEIFAESNLPLAKERREVPGSLAALLRSVRPEPSGLAERVRAGFEAFTETKVLGRDAADAVAVMAFAAGPLELLPTRDYNDARPWLFVRDKTTAEKTLNLPKSCPYVEIYKSDKWWGLIPENNNKLLDPAGLVSNGEKGLAGLDVESAKLTGDNLDAEVQLNGMYVLEIGPKYYPGDGTVPAFSSSAPRGKKGVKAVFAHGQNSEGMNRYCKVGEFNNSTGYGHQDAYTDKSGRTLFATLYSLVRLSASIS